MISILERVLGQINIRINIREVAVMSMKKFRDNNFQENSTKESTLIRFNKINNTKIIQRKDRYQIGINTNMLGVKDKDKAVDSRKWVWV